MNIIDIITLKHPGIERITYWSSHPDGTPWNDPYEGLIWENTDIPKPSKEELAQWELEVAPVKDMLDIRQARRDNYPAMGDQLDALYKAMDAGILPKIDGFYAEIKAVKERFPKP